MSKATTAKKSRRVRAALGLPCPECGTGTAVYYTRRRPDGTFRFRVCPSCGTAGGTLEQFIARKSSTCGNANSTCGQAGQNVPDITPPRPAQTSK